MRFAAQKGRIQIYSSGQIDNIQVNPAQRGLRIAVFGIVLPITDPMWGGELSQLDDDAEGMAWVQERFFPTRIRGSRVQDREPCRFHRPHRLKYVIDPEGEMVRPGATGNQEPFDEVVLIRTKRLQELKAHAIGELPLLESESRRVTVLERFGAEMFAQKL